MLNAKQFIKLELGDQVGCFGEVFTVIDLQSINGRQEPDLLSESGRREKSGIFYAGQMTYVGKIELSEQHRAYLAREKAYLAKLKEEQSTLPGAVTVEVEQESEDMKILAAYEQDMLI